MPTDLDLLQCIDRLGSPRILVFGDLILDRYTWGRVDRVSPEAPVPVLLHERREERPGGAAAVASLLASLGARVTCGGVVGDDGEGARLRGLLAAQSIDAELIETEAARPTVLKERFISVQHGHAQLMRFDREIVEPLRREVEARLLAALLPAIPECAAVLISDYGKGVCTPALLRSIIDACQGASVPVLVDPARAADYSRYRGATLITPNRTEAELAAGRSIGGPDEALLVAECLRRDVELRAAVITLDGQGMVLAEAEGAARHIPTRARAVYDITGAGDTVLAMLGMCLAARLRLHDACRLANVAGGIQVERVGVSRITPDQLRRDIKAAGVSRDDRGPHIRKIVSLVEATAIADNARNAGRRVVFTNGCFAALHAGHVAYLREARALGNVLMVAVNSAESIRRLKGDRPIIPDADRLAMLAALSFVDHVLVFDEDTPHALLRVIRPDVLVKGGTTEWIVGREIVESYGGQVLTLPAVAGISTTKLLAPSAD